MTDDLASALRLQRSTGRMTAPEIRRRMLEAALVVVRETGMTLGFNDLQMDEVIKVAGVSRSSAYRIYRSRESLISDVLNETAAIFAEQLSDNRSLLLATELVASRPDLHPTQEGRRRLLLELIRVVLEQNYYRTIDSAPWQSFLATSAALLADDGSDSLRRVAQTLRRGSDRFVEEMAAFHEALSKLLGFRLRDDFVGGFTLYTVLGSSMVEGLAVRHLSNPAVTDNFYIGPPTIGDEPTEWAPSAIGFLAIFNQFLEPDPDFDPRSIDGYLRELTDATKAQSGATEGAPGS